MTTNTAVPDAKTGGVLLALGAAMFVYVIDTTIMSVSISDLVVDLDTELSQIQLAITVYTLTMAAFMVTGGKLGKMWGAKRAFQVGLVVYGVGTVTTALSANVAMLLIGWSILEGLGSALIVPAVNTLVRANFDGSKRAAAYGTLGGVAAAGAAVGPIVGGWVTTTYTWRLAFWVEAAIVVAVLVFSVRIRDSAKDSSASLDYLGVLLSVAGLGLFVYGILQTSTLGWGSGTVWVLIVVGAVLVAIFARRAVNQELDGGDPLMRPSILKRPAMSPGLAVMMSQTFVQNGVLFLIPVYAQLVLGEDALGTGLTVLPLSIGVMAFSVGTAKLGHRIYPRTIIQAGMVLLFVGGVLIALAIPNADSKWDLALALFVMGASIGVIAAQLPNLMLSLVEPNETSEASALQGTAQNLGMSLGTAVAGSVIIVALGAAFATGIDDSEVLTAETRADVEEILEQNAETMGTEFEDLVADQGPEVGDEILRISKEASDGAFQLTVLILGLVSLIGYVWAFKLPKIKLAGDPVDEAIRGTGMIPKFQLEPAGDDGEVAGTGGGRDPA